MQQSSADKRFEKYSMSRTKNVFQDIKHTTLRAKEYPQSSEGMTAPMTPGTLTNIIR